MNATLNQKFKVARKLFPVTASKSGIIYFNSASTGPLCRPVKEAIDKYFTLCQYLDRDDDRNAFGDLSKIRRLGAKIIGAHSDEVGFGWNTGYGLNIAAQGLPLKSGDEILLSDVEFPSNVYPWLVLKERGIKVKFIKSNNGFFNIDYFRKAITGRSRVLSLSQVQFFNGFKNDLAVIGEICRANNIYFVVDGIQGCGVEPIDVRKMQIDIFASGAQKWLLGQLGSGIFFIKKELQGKLRRPLASWLAVDWKLNFSNLFFYDLPFFDSARGFELGTYPYAQVHALAASLELITSLGVRNIQEHNYRLLDILISYLESDKRFTIKSNLERMHRSSIFVFSCKEARRLYQYLRKHNIICSFREGAVRISVHLFNDESDIQLLVNVLKKFA
jgi:cysteine desulfurase/selenocysteine lyase